MISPIRVLQQLLAEIEAGAVVVDRVEVEDGGIFVAFKLPPVAEVPQPAPTPPSTTCPDCGGPGVDVEGGAERYCPDCDKAWPVGAQLSPP